MSIGSTQLSCAGVVFQANLTLINSLKLKGNCFLKSNTDTPLVVTSGTGLDLGAGATLDSVE